MQPDPPEPFTQRLLRSLDNRIRLLHRSNSHFFILAASGNVYTVTLSTSPSCTCPDPTTPCNHILFLYIRVLSLPLNDTCLRRRTLRPCQLSRLLSSPVSRETVAGASLRKRFREILYLRRNKPDVRVEEGSNCPICLEEMGVGGRRVVACGTCKNPIHEECLMGWKRRRTRTCVICRAKWRDKGDEVQERYINLSAYLCADDDVALANHGQENCGGQC